MTRLELIARSNKTLTAIAREAGLGVSFVSQWAKGHKHASFANTAKIARAMGATLDEISAADT